MKLPPSKVLYKDRLELRLFSPRDAQAIFQAVQDSRLSLKRFMGWAHDADDFDGACAIYAAFEAQSLMGKAVHFAGYDSATGEFVLCVSLTPCSYLNPFSFGIGYWVSSPWQGRGLATLATKIITVLAFRHYEAQRLSVVCNTENLASQRVIEKCGFTFEGTLRNYQSRPTPQLVAQGLSSCADVLSYAMTPDDLCALPWYDALADALVIRPLGG